MGDNVGVGEVVRHVDHLVWRRVSRVGNGDSLSSLVGESLAAADCGVGLSSGLELSKVDNKDVGRSSRCTWNTEIVYVVGGLGGSGDVAIGGEGWGSNRLPSDGG